MATNDNGCTIVPYFHIPEENLGDFKVLCEELVEQTGKESDCLYYGFSFDGNTAHCREGYRHAEGLLAHLNNVDSLLRRALKISKITRLEVHGPESELAKLRKPLAALKPQFFVLEYGFRN